MSRERENPMRAFCVCAAAFALAGAPGQPPAGRGDSAAVARAATVLDNPRVRAYRATADVVAGVERGGGVVVWLRDSAAGKAGRAIWLDDVAAAPAGAGKDEVVIVQPRGGPTPPSGAPAAGSQPGGAPFTGMSFVPLFENARVSVIRARMEVDAREGQHTHGSDTIVVHLSGGEIEDTAGGKTVVNRWKPGDVEFEGRGSSHSARNISHPVDVVLVALKP
jgi:quercetin dioxygenase-like cupin family protein